MTSLNFEVIVVSLREYYFTRGQSRVQNLDRLGLSHCLRTLSWLQSVLFLQTAEIASGTVIITECSKTSEARRFPYDCARVPKKSSSSIRVSSDPSWLDSTNNYCENYKPGPVYPSRVGFAYVHAIDRLKPHEAQRDLLSIPNILLR